MTFRLGLSARIIVLLSLALLPLGAIAVWQTITIVREQSAQVHGALYALTERASTRERQVVERALGAAEVLRAEAARARVEPERCRDVLSQMAARAPYAFVSFHDADGSVVCASQAVALPFDDEPSFAEQGRTYDLSAVSHDPRTGGSALILRVAARLGDDGPDHIRLHLPHSGFEPQSDGTLGRRPDGLITLNERGQVLTSEAGEAATDALLPDTDNLAALIQNIPTQFAGPSRDGTPRQFTLVPLVPGTLYALGVWPGTDSAVSIVRPVWSTVSLAILMWLASVTVAYFAMHRLVLRGVTDLRNEFGAFRESRSLASTPTRARAELAEMATDFRELAATVLRDEADLEHAVHEKNVLLKEVHHRVKNNLQLINSIINMILRKPYSAQTHAVVRRLQDRVMALASVHGALYQAEQMDRIDAASLIDRIVGQTLAIGLPHDAGLEVRKDLNRVVLYPDQALPLTLLVSETITNALKYFGGKAPWLRISLSLRDTEEGQFARLEIKNSVADTVDDSESTGLGSLLIGAFVRQLDGTMTQVDTPGVFGFVFDFPVKEFSENDAAPPEPVGTAA